ncbi:FtsK/SpoIIIE domain-containing protein [Microbacterium elymi]|uniref:FtsK/SpoIIIE domain-containing protein n=1 Tax=Microbacterium elymi TaxID=2909587 RepID=A0ABY5NIU4_9MICO|nr:FtsK/SpoIIIE domain-containing protein [Microbacterium elymi]UUT35056.1 FtsK/SpoIIIE domain-containing protein [Microbacterium elymi]
MLGALMLWAVTGTTTMLWFAALGPLIAVGSLADAARAARRDRRRAQRDAAAARARVATAVTARHDAERIALWTRNPDVRRLLGDGDDRDIWRPASGRGEVLVVGRGPASSAVRVEGGDDDPDGAALRRNAGRLDDAPVTVPTSRGIAVAGPDPLARAVQRALVLQLCLALPPDRLRITDLLDDADPEVAWVRRLPHHASPQGSGAQPASDGRLPHTVVVCGATAPAGAAAIARTGLEAAAPPACGAVLTLTGIDRGRVVQDGDATDVQVEGLGLEQAVLLAGGLAERAEEMYGRSGPDTPVQLAELLTRADRAEAGGLSAVLGTARGARFAVDLVADGPHAVVAGVTGSGKSELLTTWVTALCASYRTDEVAFLLADFKGGTAFDALAALPHVTGVITDLDAGGARRALQSLRAELRRREAEIVRVGGREVGDTDLPRLVIVVDEFAALSASHPELQELFVDIAARGRALGMHLVLGTQRAAGTFREALLANCPLRISLRVTDAADSRLLLGTDDAATLSGAPAHRGIALIRRAADAAPCAVRVARTSPRLIAATAASGRGDRPRPPWLPPLPSRLSLAEASAAVVEGIVLGIADEPDRQRQVPVVLAETERGLCAIGTAGSGRTTLLATIAGQAAAAIWIPAQPEAAWDAVAELADRPPGPGTVVMVDDVDALLAQYPLDYAQALGERLERITHACGATGARIVLSAQRLSGMTARLADLIPRRVLLAAGGRADFVAAGGAPGDYEDRMPPGRAVVDGRRMQIALPATAVPRAQAETPLWTPCAGLTGIVARSGPGRRLLASVADAAGAAVLEVDDLSSLPAAPRAHTIVIGDAEQWQRGWRVLHAIRGEHDLLIDASCGPDYRLLTGDRTLPPYCVPGRGRAWLLRAGAAPVRVRIEAPHPDAPRP